MKKIPTRVAVSINPVDIFAPLLGLAGLAAIVLSSMRW
jgi:hypothetical protein